MPMDAAQAVWLSHFSLNQLTGDLKRFLWHRILMREGRTGRPLAQRAMTSIGERRPRQVDDVLCGPAAASPFDHHTPPAKGRLRPLDLSVVRTLAQLAAQIATLV